MLDMFASHQKACERYNERQNKGEIGRRPSHTADECPGHIERSILHYLRSIWASEHYDQRMRGLGKLIAPISWQFVPGGSLPADVDPKTDPAPIGRSRDFFRNLNRARRLTDVIDPIGPIGYLFSFVINCLRNDPALINLHTELSYLRTAHARREVSVEMWKARGMRLRQKVAAASRWSVDDYKSVLLDCIISETRHGTRCAETRPSLVA
jgi:hypothetical protein